jgi:hypothetical protein
MKKTFDAVESSRRWRRKTSRLLRDMTSAERIAFLNRRLANWPAATAAKPALEPAHR